MLADAVGTVVKSQAALALGLERMVKSTATLANNSQTISKSFTAPNPGVVMNGKVLIEGNNLRKANAPVDEVTGQAFVNGGNVEMRLTKSLVGTAIQQAVLDGSTHQRRRCAG